MLNSLKNIFHQAEDVHQDDTDHLHLLSGLMMEAANIDGQVDQQEVNKISKVLINTFHEDPSAVEAELKKCLEELGMHKPLHSFTSQINKSFSNEKKIILLEILWEIILEDGEVHDFESNLIRRLAGLLYISDINCGNAKKRALNKITNNELG
ncbi:TerB family tellurite resistance protein [Alphaproteobacteria bacterium]|nr:TerB family tellurite resistance protein [Alphaproteobacteria bacterium]